MCIRDRSCAIRSGAGAEGWRSANRGIHEMSLNSARDGELQRTESGEGAPGAPGAGARRGRRRWLVAAVVAVLADFVLSRVCAGQASSANAAKGGALRAVPVVATAARTGDFGVYQNGLGTVTPVKTVTVRSPFWY